MSLSSGIKTAMGEAVSWTIAGACVVGTFFYYDDLKAAFSPVPQSQLTERSQPQRHQVAKLNTLQNQSSMRQPSADSGYLVEIAAGPRGHYRTSAHVNGRPTDVLVDTGATYVGLTYKDAERAGIFVSDKDFKYKTQTANGYSRIAIVTIDRVAIGDIEVRNVKATVAQPGKLHVTLLGMSFLGKLRRTQMHRGRLILEN